MDVINEEVVEHSKNKEFPLQTFNLPYSDKSFRPDSLNTRPTNLTATTSVSLPSVLVPERFKSIKTTSWNATQDFGTHIWNLEVTNTWLSAKMKELIPLEILRRHLGHSFDFDIQTEIHQSVQHTGRLAWYWVPGPMEIDSPCPFRQFEWDTDLERRIAQRNPVFMDPQSNNVQVFSLPLRTHFNNFFAENNDRYVYGHLYLTVWSKLNTVAEKTSLPINMYCRLANYKPDRPV